MTKSESQQILQETGVARDKACQLLNGLFEAKQQVRRGVGAGREPDAMEVVTGRSAIDNAIASTQRMIERLDRTIEQVRDHLDPEEAAELGLDPQPACGESAGHA